MTNLVEVTKKAQKANREGDQVSILMKATLQRENKLV